ncbi:putative abc transporter integral membrane protein [hydrocarbon metagenome]|uniref:Putative abc transporter integral membrane protein n=1 Tax=hydrocarbon metagenome TaxID=938273 RepID=A0A0W8E9H6_9ZZZZ
MAIIIKFISKNIWEKKLRTLLILFSICLSTALLFSSLGISQNIAQVYLKQIRSQIGDAELTIYAGKDSPSRYFRTDRAEIYRENLDYIIGTVSETGVYKVNPREQVQVNLLGYKLEDLQMINPLDIQQKYSLSPFKGSKIIISRVTADKYDLQAGHNLDIKINDQLHRFTIAAVAAPEGLLTPGANGFSAVVPRETLASLIGEKGKVSQMFVKTADPVHIDRTLDSLSEQYNRYEVNKTITESELSEFTDVIRMPFMLMLLLVGLISIFVIYTAFKVIVLERMPMMGTFRSVGATRKITNLILLTESLIYGVLGGITGCTLGIGILYAMTYSLANTPWSTTPPDVQLTYNFLYLGISFAGAVILSFVSSLIPIFRVSNVPLRDIILNTYSKQDDDVKRNKTLPALIILVLILLVPPFLPGKAAGILSVLGIIIGTVAIVWLIPRITDIFVLLYEKFIPNLFGNEGILAIKNIRNNKEMLNNITLLTIGLASLLLINTISFSVGREVTDAYRDFKFDVMVFLPQADRSLESQIRSVQGVESSLGIYQVNQVEIAGTNEKIGTVYGMDGNRMLDFFDYRLQGDVEQILLQFSSERCIIPSTFMKKKLDLKVGEKLTLKTETGEKTYQIAGFSNTLMNNGNIALIPDKYVKSDWQLKYYSSLWILTVGDPDIVSQALKDKFVRNNIGSITKNELRESNDQANNQLLALLQGFSLVTLIIGIFGVFNNYVVSLLTRKRFLAVFRSIGMSQKQMVKVLLVEALAGGLIAGVTGSLGGLIYLIQSGYIMFSLNLPIGIIYSPGLFMQAVIAGIVIAVLASLGPSRQTARLEIVKELKYE